MCPRVDARRRRWWFCDLAKVAPRSMRASTSHSRMNKIINQGGEKFLIALTILVKASPRLEEKVDFHLSRSKSLGARSD